jgi:decaprenylphospho-beta-D-erythro-pentofuranosid-2-ulose 2-reductase
MQDGLGSVQRVLVLGAASDIAAATLHRLVRDRTRSVVLASREPDRLDKLAHELREAGATEVDCVPFDAVDYASHERLVDRIFTTADIDLILVTFGVLGDQHAAEHDRAKAVEIAGVNYLGAVSVLSAVTQRLRAQGHGVIVGLSSVAGERVRRSNFIYGSSKAGFDGYLQGLGESLAGTGVRVLVVRPGFVHTKMTAGLAAAALAVTPDTVADAIVRGIAEGRELIWVPPALRWVMVVLRHLPKPVFRRLPI